MNWQLQDAKNQFSKLVQSACTHGPQVVTVRGEPSVVVLSVRDYDALRANRSTLVDCLLAGPVWDQDFIDAVARREKTPGRTIDF